MRSRDCNNARAEFYGKSANQRGAIVLEETRAHAEIVRDAFAVPKLPNVKEVVIEPCRREQHYYEL